MPDDTATRVEGVPDWSTSTADVCCPLCDYNLRGLTDRRCPECGYRFAWAEVLSPPPTHPYLFECHPRRNVWSFCKTQLGGFLPRRFWRTLRPEVKLRPVRLVVYWVLAVGLLAAGAATGVGRTAVDVKSGNRRQAARVLAFYKRMATPIPYGLTPAQYASHWCDPPVASRAFWRQVFRSNGEQQTTLAVAVILLWPWLTFAALQVFAASMRKARVRRGHVLRCAVYSCDFGLVAGVAIVLVLGANGYGSVPAQSAMLLSGVPLAAYVTYRLGTAYRLYLRFDRPMLTALASQVIVFLVGFKAALWAMGY